MTAEIDHTVVEMVEITAFLKKQLILGFLKRPQKFEKNPLLVLTLQNNRQNKWPSHNILTLTNYSK